MKLKKRITALMLAVTAVVASVCMTACGNDDAGNGDGGAGSDNKSEIIADEAAWKAAFDFSETTNATFTVTGMEGNDRVDLYKFDGDKYYRKMSDSERSLERYIMYSDEVYDQQYPEHGTEYEYSLDEDGNWKLTKSIIFDRDTVANTTKEVFELVSDYNEETGERVGYLDERFADFEYNDQTGRYEATISTPGAGVGEFIDISVWLVFKGGKIYEGMYNVEFGGGVVYEINFTLTDIGTTVVTLPTVAEE